MMYFNRINLFSFRTLLIFLSIAFISIIIGCQGHVNDESEELAALGVSNLSKFDRASGIIKGARDVADSDNVWNALANTFNLFPTSPRPVPSKNESLFRVKIDLSDYSLIGKRKGVRILYNTFNWKKSIVGLGLKELNLLDGIELSAIEFRFFKNGETAPNKVLSGRFPIRLGFENNIATVLPFVALEEGKYSKIQIVFSSIGQAYISGKEYQIGLNKTSLISDVVIDVRSDKMTNVILCPDFVPDILKDFGQSKLNEIIPSRRFKKEFLISNISFNLPNLYSKSWISEPIEDISLNINSVSVVYANGKKVKISDSPTSYNLNDLRNGNVALIASKPIEQGKIKGIIIHSPRISRVTLGNGNRFAFTLPYFEEIWYPFSLEHKNDRITETFLEVDDSQINLFSNTERIGILSKIKFNYKNTLSFSNELEFMILKALGARYNTVAKKSDRVLLGSANSVNYQPIYKIQFGWVIESLSSLSISENLSLVEDDNKNTIYIKNTGGMYSGLRMTGFGMPTINENEISVYFLNQETESDKYYFSSGLLSKVVSGTIASPQIGNYKYTPEDSPEFVLELDPGSSDYFYFYNKDLKNIVRETLRYFDRTNAKSSLNVSYKKWLSKEIAEVQPNTCSDEIVEFLRKTGNRMILSSYPDSICSQSVCSYRWSCSDSEEIIASNILLLPNDSAINNVESSIDSLRFTVAKGIFSAIGFDACNIGAEDCQINSDRLSDWFYPLFQGDTGEIMTSAKITDMKIKYGELSALEEALLAEANAFIDSAAAFCNPSPCVFPRDEQDPVFRPTTDEIQYYDSYFLDEETSSINDPAEFITYNFNNQDLYFHSSRILKTPVERYMQNAISVTQAKIQNMPREYLRDHIKQLYFQIQRREKLLKELKDSLDYTYVQFIESELKVLIQIRREMLRALSA